MTKAEMQAHHSAYHAWVSKAQYARDEGQYPEAIINACAAWDYLDGMMQFERKYLNKQFETLEAIEIVLDCAPLLFDFQSLDRLERLLKEQRRIEKHTTADLGERLVASRFNLECGLKFWSYLEQRGGCKQDEIFLAQGRELIAWKMFAERWAKLNVIGCIRDGSSYRFTFSTDSQRTARAKCANCGVIAKATKSKFWSKVRCPKCRKVAYFVLLRETPAL